MYLPVAFCGFELIFQLSDSVDSSTVGGLWSQTFVPGQHFPGSSWHEAQPSYCHPAYHEEPEILSRSPSQPTPAPYDWGSPGLCSSIGGTWGTGTPPSPSASLRESALESLEEGWDPASWQCPVGVSLYKPGIYRSLPGSP